jgi:general stress protein 26
MSSADNLLKAASSAIASAKYCWLATPGEGGLVNARPMGRTPRASDDDELLIRFVTDGRSRKIAEIRSNAKVTVIVQKEAEDAYFTLLGDAEIRPRACEDARFWRDGYRVYFPYPGDVESAAFVEVRVRRLELWMRGVTPEPFGLRPTVLERDQHGNWAGAAL